MGLGEKRLPVDGSSSSSKRPKRILAADTISEGANVCRAELDREERRDEVTREGTYNIENHGKAKQADNANMPVHGSTASVELQTVTRPLASNAEQIAELKSTTDQQFAALEAMMIAVRAENADLSHKFASLQDTLATVRAEHDLLKLKFTALAARSTALEAQNTALEAQNTALESQNTTIETSMAAQTNITDKLATTVESQNKQLSQIGTEVGALRADSTTRVNQFLSFENKLRTMEIGESMRRIRTIEINRRLSAVATQASDIDRRVSAIENERTKTGNKIQTLELGGTALKDRVAVLENKDATVGSLHKKIGGKLQSAANHSAKVLREVVAVKGQVDRVNHDLSAAKRDITAGWSQLVVVGGRVADLRVDVDNENNSIRQRLAVVERQNAVLGRGLYYYDGGVRYTRQ